MSMEETSVEETAPATAAQDEAGAPPVRTVRYPSADFPVPPAIEFEVPES